MRPLAGLVVLTVTWIHVPRPASAEVLSMEEVERWALGSETVRADVEGRISVAEAALDQARSGRHPVVAIAGDASMAPGGQLIDVQSTSGERFLVQGSHQLGEPGAFTALPRFGAVVTVQTPLIDFGRTATAERGAEHRIRSARMEADAFRRGVLREARSAYLGWLVAHAQRRLMLTHVSESEAEVRMLGARIAEGARSPAEMTTARQALTATKLDLAQSDAELDRARIALQQIMNAPLPGGAEPDLALLDSPGPQAAPSAGSEAAALEQEAAAVSADAEGLRRRSAPLVSAGGEMGLRGQSDLLFPAYRIGIAISVPLWDGGVGNAQARAAAAQAARLRAQARASAHGNLEQRARAESDWTHAHERVRLAQELQTLGQQAVTQATERYRLGTADLMAVADARGRLTQAELQLLAAKAARMDAGLRLRGDGLASGR